VPDFKLPDGSNLLKEVLQESFVAPKGSRLDASDLFQIFQAPDRAWKQEDLEWTGDKLIMHPVFRTQVSMTNARPVFDEELYDFLARLLLPIERSAETKPFKMPSRRVEWAWYEFERRRLENSISDREEELKTLVTRQKAVEDSLRSNKDALKRHTANRPGMKRAIRLFIKEGEGTKGKAPVAQGTGTVEKAPEGRVTYQVPEQASALVREEDFAKQLRLARYLAASSLPPARPLEPGLKSRAPRPERSLKKAGSKAKAEPTRQKASEAELAKERRRAGRGHAFSSR
jgi:hypothetical protein